MDEKKPIPFALLYAEAENRIFEAVSAAASVNKIPFFLLDGILTNILHQVRKNAEAERAQAQQTYEDQKKTESEEEECKKQ